MSEACSTCFKMNHDESLIIARSEAKKLAVQNSQSMAIVIEDDQYKLYEAFYAYSNHMNVKETVSYL